jgi:hypothetical protein
MNKNSLNKGYKVILNDKLGFDNQSDRDKYNICEVTIKEVWLNSRGEVDTFFIEEDGGYFEWVPNDIKEVVTKKI